MLIWFVIVYLMVSVGIGVYASSKVHSAKDFAVAGRHLPLPIVTATVFATWFGAETVLGISAQFTKEGLHGVVSDPFGASLCLILAGLFFANRLYRMNLLTIGDYYRVRYSRSVELVMTLCIVLSYLGWVAAQVNALGLVFNVVSGGEIPRYLGMIIGAVIVLTYTMFGGMWSVALLDFVQMTVIMCGMLFIAWLIGDKTGGVAVVVDHANQAGKLDFFPKGGLSEWVPFIGTWLTMMLGSIPQQDVFQRITSAKTEKIAVRGSVLGGSLYFVFAFVPMFLAYSATLIDPKVFGDLLEKDSQLVLPTLILNYTPVFAQVIFFGALLSAIMSCSSATLLAPSVAFTENILKHFAFKNMTDQQFLRAMRITLLCFGMVVLCYALFTTDSISKMVEKAYRVTLVGAFVPLLFGLYWKRATNQGAVFSMVLGLSSWVMLEALSGYVDDVARFCDVWLPQIVGLMFSLFGMVAGSLLPQKIGGPLAGGPGQAQLHPQAAAHTGHVAEPPHHHIP
jgi:SSS family solute:Na+ symporter